MIDSRQITRQQLVLVVDDQEINRDVLGMILEDYYECIYACDGREALELIEKHRDRLSVVLMDLIMPEMDGFEVLDRIRHDEHLMHIPVIVLTAERDAELKALQMGAADFITKPFNMHEVIRARVGRIIELSEGRQLISAAEHDRLTGLYARNFFFEYVNRICQNAKDRRMDAVAIDIESFHSVNALNGRRFGDQILRLLGEELRSFLSETEGIASRLEADRFALFCQSQEDYQVLLERLQKKVDQSSKNASVRIRMGVKPWTEGVEPVIMFDQATAACNMIRGSYMTHLMIYDEEMQKKEMLNQRLMNDIRRAVDEHELVVFYQPKYDIQCSSPRLASAEALIRWRHPEMGMIPPGSFIPLFEGTGQISLIDRFVWSEAARQMADWYRRYGIIIPVSVNVSRVDVFDEALEERLKNLVKENGLAQKSLKLEVTESAYTDNAQQLIDVIERLRSSGFEIEMDDFGTGYSSLNMLTSMPIDVLKMDMKFIRNIEQSAKDLRMVELVLDIARYLKVPVVAEGVENETQMALLKNAGCAIVQGFYFSKPLPPEEFEVLIQKEISIKRGDRQ